MSKDDAGDYDVLTVISGSFKKYLPQIIKLKHELKKLNVGVLSPEGDGAINYDQSKDGFTVFVSDKIYNHKMLQDSIFAKVRRSSFLTVANFEGYLGSATILEIGYAVALGIPVYTLEAVKDPHLALYCHLLSDFFPGINLS